MLLDDLATAAEVECDDDDDEEGEVEEDTLRRAEEEEDDDEDDDAAPLGGDECGPISQSEEVAGEEATIASGERANEYKRRLEPAAACT